MRRRAPEVLTLALARRAERQLLVRVVAAVVVAVAEPAAPDAQVVVAAFDQTWRPQARVRVQGRR